MSKEKSKTKKEGHRPKKGSESKTKTENVLKVSKNDDPDDNELDKFDKLVKKNKISGKPRYFGLEGKWWWGMTERESRKHIESEQIHKDRKKEEKSEIKKEETSDIKTDAKSEIKKEETSDIKPEIVKEETSDIKN